MSPTASLTLEFHTGQARFLDSPALYRGFVGGRGAGKTHIGAYDLLKRAKRGRLYLVAAPTYTMLKDACLRTFLTLARQLRFVADVNHSDLRVLLGNGAEVLFRSADDPERLRGPNLSGVWLDEASVMSREAFEVVIGCLRQQGEQGWFSATFTPKGQAHWTYDVFGTGRPDVELVHAATVDNPFNPESFARSLAEQYPAELAQQELGGEFIDLSDALIVVPLSVARAAEETTHPVGRVEVIACDVARRGKDRTVILGRRGRVARILWRAQGQDTMQTAGMLAEIHAQSPNAHIVVDGVGVGAGVIDRLREQGIGVIECQGGAAASDSGRFVNRISELWWRMREGYEAGLDLESDDHLRSQVSSRRYKIQSDRRISIESKEGMHAEGRESPDEADALALSFAVDWDVSGRARLTAGSDADERDDEGEAPRGGEVGFGSKYDRASVQAGRGSDLAPWSPSRFSPMRKGFRR